MAGLFVALAGAALALAGETRRGLRARGSAASLPIAVLNLAFPTGGFEPFVFSAFVAIPLLAVARALAGPAEYRALRIGAVLYALAGAGCCS